MTQNPPATETNDHRALPRGGWLSRHASVLLVGYWPLLAVGTHWPSLPVPETPAHPFMAVLQLDKLAHLIGFGGLMLLVLFSRLTGPSRRWSMRCAVALSICLSYAVVDELTQTFMANRTVSVADLVANALAIVGVYLVASQSKHNARPWLSRMLLWPMLLSLPVALAMLLSQQVMEQLIEIKRSWGWLDGLDIGRLDYWAHGVGSFVITSVVLFVLPAGSRRPRRTMLVLLLMLLVSGPVIEIAQHYTGRSVQAMDVLAHSIGVLLGMMAYTAWPFRRSASHSGAQALTGPGLAEDAGSLGFVGHAVLVSLLTLLSRFAGLARDAVLAAALGLSTAADAFFIGFLVPNLFRRLFGEGALTAAFIPNYTELLQRDPALAKRFATLTLTLLSVVLVGITLIGELVLWWIATTIAPEHKASLAIQYTRVMLPYMPLICAVALIGGMLQVHKRFGPPAAAPLVLNGIIVLAVLLCTGFFQNDTSPGIVALWVAVGVVLAGVMQLYWQAAVLLRVTGLSRSFKGCWPTMRSMLIMMGPMVLGLAVFQINALLDALIAFFFAPPAEAASTTGSSSGQQLSLFGQTFDAPLRNGDVAALNWSQRLYQFPLGVFGIAIATAIFPALSAAAAKFVGSDDEQDKPAQPQAASGEFADIVRQGLRLTAFIALPASAGLILVREPLARAVFEHGSFTRDDAMRVSVILAGYASSVWAYSMTHTLTRAFYALKDATTPLKVSAAMVLLNLILNLSLIWSLGAAGLAWSTAISAAGQVTLLVMLLRKRVDRPIDETVINSWTRTMIATTVMAGVLFAVTSTVGLGTLNWAQSTGLLVGMVLLGMAVFFVVARLMRAEELGWLRRRSIR